MMILRLMLCLGAIGFLLSIILDLGDVKSGVFFMIACISIAGIEVVKNIHRSTGRHMRHNAEMMNIMIDILKDSK